jgi:hypothetical protein
MPENQVTLDELIDDCWKALRPSLCRRAVLGKKRCAELLMRACAHFPDAELSALSAKSQGVQDRKKLLEAQVMSGYLRDHGMQKDNNYGFVFMSVVLAWAVEAIVRYLLSRWFSGRLDVGELRRQCGWEAT